jgi:hypothetical protein
MKTLNLLYNKEKTNYNLSFKTSELKNIEYETENLLNKKFFDVFQYFFQMPNFYSENYQKKWELAFRFDTKGIMLNKFITKQLKAQRKESPVTKRAIKMQAELFRVSRECSVWAKTNPDLTKKGDTKNKVFGVPSSQNSSYVVGYYKEGELGREDVSILEELMWQIALIFGWEESFAATKAIHLNLTHKGGVQVAHRGISIEDYISRKNIPNNQKIISQDELIEGTFITLTFGMFDAHFDNIIINKGGKIRFFDNGRSMPHSNGFIHRINGPTPSYRSALLALSGSYEKLSTEHLQKIKNSITKQKKRMKHVKTFLLSTFTQNRIRKLPPRWFSTEEAIAAMEERLDNMEKALTDNKIGCLRDLVFAAMPGFNFTAILQMLLFEGNIPEIKMEDTQDLIEIQQYTLDDVGYDSMNTLLENCIKMGIDPQQIKDWCENSSLSFEQVICKTSGFIQNPEGIYQRSISKELYQSAQNILIDLEKKHNIDLKDFDLLDANQFTQFTLNKTLELFKKKMGEEFAIELPDKEAIEDKQKQLINPGDYFFVIDDSQKPTACEIHYKNKNDQIVSKTFESTLYPGKIKVLGIKESILIDNLSNTLKSED